MKSRGVYETPGGTILLAAHRAMESITLDRGACAPQGRADAALCGADLQRLLVLARARNAAGAIDQSQEHVEGEVR
jgi:argininosuccinate synthase